MVSGGASRQAALREVGLRETVGNMPAAVILGLDSLQGLQAARTLAARQVPVVGISKNRQHYGSKTRVCEEIHFCASNEEILKKLDALDQAAKQRCVIIPCTDSLVALVSRNRRRLSDRYHVTLPEPGVVDLMQDKVAFYRFALQNGFPIPATRFLFSRSHAEQAAVDLIFPCILKPRSRTSSWTANTAMKAFELHNPEELIRRYDICSGWVDALIVQELVAGPPTNHITCNCYFDRNGVPVLAFTSRKLRQWPPNTGQGSLSESWDDEIVLEETMRLFRHVGFRGLGYLEMKIDERTGQHLIIEPNIGRPTGRSSNAEAAGVELLYTAYCDALGRPLPPVPQQPQVGVKWAFLRQDLQSVLHQLKHGELDIRSALKSSRGIEAHALFSWRDPAPFVSDLLRSGRLALSTRQRRRRAVT